MSQDIQLLLRLQLDLYKKKKVMIGKTNSIEATLNFNIDNYNCWLSYTDEIMEFLTGIVFKY